ncbi:MAG: TolC family protein [Gammaproteobacteria bacterium]
MKSNRSFSHSIAAAAGPALICLATLAAAQQTPQSERVERYALIDQSQFASEAEISDLIRQSLGAQAEAASELSARDAAMSALRKNLPIQRSQVAEEIANAALLEAQAVFDPVLRFSISYGRDKTFDRIETGQRDVLATTPNPNGDNELTLDDPEDPREIIVDFEDPRPASAEEVQVVASQESIFGAIDSFTYQIGLEQQLPWGADLALLYQALDQDTFFVNNPQVIANNPDPSAQGLASFGSYGKPWVSALLLSLGVPVPGGKEFGRYADQEVDIQLAGFGTQRAVQDVETTINNTLLNVDLTYWQLVNNLLTLHATVENRKGVEQLLGITQRRFDQRVATNYDLAQVQAELARIKAQEQLAWDSYTLASDALVEILDIEGSAPILPTGYLAALSEPFPIDEQEVFTVGNRENPELAGADVDVQAAQLEQQRRKIRTRPDANFLAQIQLSQSNRVFGYDDLFESAGNVFDPDILTQRYGVDYIYPWRNRAVKAAFARARNDTERLELARRAADNRLNRDLNNGIIGLQSAVRRIKISEQNLKLAKLAYEKAVQRRGGRQIGEYQVIVQSSNLLTARLNHIQARTQRKQEEARVLAAMGRLAQVYAERTAQTEVDRHRLAVLQANGVLRHFGDSGS